MYLKSSGDGRHDDTSLSAQPVWEWRQEDHEFEINLELLDKPKSTNDDKASPSKQVAAQDCPAHMASQKENPSVLSVLVLHMYKIKMPLSN